MAEASLPLSRRPCRRGRAPAKTQQAGTGQMHRRQPSKALDRADVRDIIDAEVHAEKSGKRLNTAVTIHPKFLDAGPAASAPSDVSRWLAWLNNKIRIWCARDRGFGYYAIW